MPDISMCINTKCPVRKMCYRYRAIPDEYQSYAGFTFNVETASCEEFWYCDRKRPDIRPLRLIDNVNKEWNKEIKNEQN